MQDTLQGSSLNPYVSTLMFKIRPELETLVLCILIKNRFLSCHYTLLYPSLILSSILVHCILPVSLVLFSFTVSSLYPEFYSRSLYPPCIPSSILVHCILPVSLVLFSFTVFSLYPEFYSRSLYPPCILSSILVHCILPVSLVLFSFTVSSLYP